MAQKRPTHSKHKPIPPVEQVVEHQLEMAEQETPIPGESSADCEPPREPLRLAWIEPLAALVRRASPYQVLSFAPYTLVASSLLAALITWLQTIFQPKHPNSMLLLYFCGGGIAAAIVLHLVLRKWGAAFAKRWDADGFKAYVVSLQLGIILLVIPAYLGVDHSSASDLSWNTWGFLDKRWLVSLYVLGLGTFMVFPNLVSALLTGIASCPPDRGVSRPWPRRWLSISVKTAFGIAIAWFYLGPPWNMDVRHGYIDYHEQVHLGPVQAISKGYLPYIGPASTQYGPGSQLFYYAYMKFTGKFTLVGFREANASIHLLAAILFAVCVFQLLKLWEAPLVFLIAIMCSPLHLLGFSTSTGTLEGFYGWSNALRYTGILIVAAAIPKVLRSWKDSLPNYPALLLGLGWGLFSWLSQENLTCGTVTVLLLGLLWLTGTASGKAVLQVGISMVAGFFVFWLPVLAYYAAHGALEQFLHNYFLMPATAPIGYTNIWWWPDKSDPIYLVYVLTGPLVVALTVCTLCDVRRLKLRSNLSARQTTMLAMCIALAVAFQGSFFRSDSYHVINTLIALPIVLYLGWSDVTQWLTKSDEGKWRLRLGFTALLLLIYPLDAAVHPYATFVEPQLARLRARPRPTMPAEDDRIPFQRVTRYLSNEPRVYLEDVKLRDLLEDASQLRDLIGNRKTFVLDYPAASSQFLYFVADLTPGPVLADSLLIVNNLAEADAEKYFAAHAKECQAFIARSPGSNLALIYLQSHPKAQKLDRTVAGRPYTLLLDTSSN